MEKVRWRSENVLDGDGTFFILNALDSKDEKGRGAFPFFLYNSTHLTHLS